MSPCYTHLTALKYEFVTGDIIVADIRLGRAWGGTSNNTQFEYSVLKTFDSGVSCAPAVKHKHKTECHNTVESAHKEFINRRIYTYFNFCNSYVFTDIFLLYLKW